MSPFLRIVPLALLALASCRSSGPALEIVPVNEGLGRRGPRILCVVAHPDDEIAFAGTLFKNAHMLDGASDVLVITNGEGGFKYSTLAEDYYGLELTDEEIGRAELPAIRREEFLRGCRWMGVRDALFLDQQDHRYTQDPEEVLDPGVTPWDLVFIKQTLRTVLREGDYDLVFTLAPTGETHGHHKAATILALEAVRDLPPGQRPAVLCVRGSEIGTEPEKFSGLSNYPITGIHFGLAPIVFDRTEGFGYKGRLNYKIIANWATAEHRSQGTMQLGMNQTDHENYYFFEINSPSATERARRIFTQLEGSPFTERTYGTSAGTNAGS
jgi:N-acetylglucosamine malate deacetylase 2